MKGYTSFLPLVKIYSEEIDLSVGQSFLKKFMDFCEKISKNVQISESH